MKKVNFNSLENMQIPDSWADKAVLLSDSDKKIPPLVFTRWSRVMVALTSIILVCAMGVFVFFFSNNNDIEIRNPSSANTSYATENITSGTGEFFKPSESGQNVKENTQIQDSTSSDTQPSKTPVHTVTPTEKPTKTPVAEPTQKPTKPAEQKPTTAPTDDVTRPSAPPTMSPIPQPTDPVNQPTESPSDTVDKWNVFINVQFAKSYVLSDGKIYCRLYDSNGELMGSADIYDDSHLTELSYIPYANAQYYPYRYDIITRADWYTCVFYNSDGVTAKTKKIYLKPL